MAAPAIPPSFFGAASRVAATGLSSPRQLKDWLRDIVPNINVRKPAAVGDSIFAGYSGSPLYMRISRIAGDIPLVTSYAVSGKRSDEVLSDQIPSVIAGGFSHCFVQVGTNDISQSVSEPTLRTNVIAIFESLRDGGVEPISVGLQPVDNSGRFSRAAAHNAWRQLYCAANSIRHVPVWHKLAADGDGGYASDMGYDSVHPSSNGQQAMAGEIRSAVLKPYCIAPWLAEADDRTFGSLSGMTGLCDAAITFPDANTDGTPDNWFATGSGGTLSIQNADSGGYGKWLRCTVSAGTAAGFTVTARNLSTLGWAIGDRLAMGFRIRWVDSNQALAVTAQLTGITAAAGSDLFAMFGDIGATETGSDLYVYHECTIGAGTSCGARWTATGTGYFEVNRPIILNKTLMGL